jgi:hypothetical protein
MTFQDNRELWDHYCYKDLDIAGEPYFDIDFEKVLYLTDTGRRWNSSKSNFFDKVQSHYHYNFSSTIQIINALEKDGLPDHLMITMHPERWNDDYAAWTTELLGQNIRNIVKTMLRGLLKQ